MRTSTTYRPLQVLRRMAAAVLFSAISFAGATAQTDFEQRIAELGMQDIQNDWSDSTDITLPTPTCAYANITGFSSLPARKTDNYKGWIEVYDGSGNYFKKRIFASTQGKATMGYPKRNIKIDFCNDEWVGEETPDVTFGDWVEQDGFHLKAFYNDFFKGTSVVSYRTFGLLSLGRGENGRIWERANLKKPDSRALCYPDGFPVVVYFNGKFQGIYGWLLKKNRKNMNQKKNTPEHIHIEGYPLNLPIIWDGVINWKKLQVRTPKDLYDMDGKKYDDESPTELMDETSPYYDLATDDDKTREQKQNSAKVKQYLINMSKYFAEINALISSGASRAQIRAAIEERYDIPSIMDYVIHNLLTVNWDGVHKNYQWFTYDGKKWCIAPYDLDNTFGYGSYRILPPGQYDNCASLARQSFYHCPTTWVMKFYKPDMYERWAYLRDNGHINADIIYSLFDQWYHAVGEDNYALDHAMWPNSDSLRPDIDREPWSQVPFDFNTFKNAPTWNANDTYEKGTIVTLYSRLYKTSKTVKGVNPCVQYGYLDSLARIYPYMKAHIEAMDTYMQYKFTSIPKSYILNVTSVGWSTLCIPFQFAIPEGMKLYTVNGQHPTGGLKLQEVTEPEAYKPYLVQAAPGRYELTGYTEEEPDNTTGLWTEGNLSGTLSPRYVPQGAYVMQNHNGHLGFYRVTEDGKVKMGANKAWLTLDGAEANSFALEVDATDGITTAGEMPAIVSIHDINGVRQSRPGKGVSIIRYSNGKTIKVAR